MYPFFHEQNSSFDNHLLDAGDAHYSLVWNNDSTMGDTIDWLTELSQTTSGNALGLSGMYGVQSVWHTDPLACSSSTSVPNHWQNGARLPDASVLHQLASSEILTDFGQPSIPCTAGCAETMPSRTGEIAIPHPVPQSCDSIRYSPGKHVSGPRSRVQPTAAHSRHTPYVSHGVSHGSYPPAGGSDSPCRSNTYPTSFYYCQWSGGVNPCGTVVPGTKSAIAKHLQAVHSIRLRADKTLQACQWGGCAKGMLRESITRHILAVHLKDKAHCPSCGSEFARVDSLQRHQRTCIAKGDDSEPAAWTGGSR